MWATCSNDYISIMQCLRYNLCMHISKCGVYCSTYNYLHILQCWSTRRLNSLLYPDIEKRYSKNCNLFSQRFASAQKVARFSKTWSHLFTILLDEFFSCIPILQNSFFEKISHWSKLSCLGSVFEDKVCIRYHTTLMLQLDCILICMHILCNNYMLYVLDHGIHNFLYFCLF